MTKSSNVKKTKKPNLEDGAIEYNSSVFEIRDRHYKSLQAIRKKIRGCEKKIREMEQAEQLRLAGIKNVPTNEQEEIRSQRLEKINQKQASMAQWKEAAMIIAGTRREETTHGVTNVGISDVLDGVELLKKVVEKQDIWQYYKTPSKKHLQRSELDRLLKLAVYLNVTNDVNQPLHFCSFLSVIDYLSSPIAIGQDCPMSFPEFVKMFDKISKTLEVEVVLPKVEEPPKVEVEEPTISTNPGDISTTTAVEVKAEETTKEKHEGNKGRNRKQRNPKKAETSHNSASAHKTVVIVTDNSKNKKKPNTEDIKEEEWNNSEHPPADVPLTPRAKSPVQVTVLPGANIKHPNVPLVDLNDDGWHQVKERVKKPVVHKYPRNDGYNRGPNNQKRHFNGESTYKPNYGPNKVAHRQHVNGRAFQGAS